MAEQSMLMLANEIRRLLRQELGEFGQTVFITQCSELNIKPEKIRPGDLLRLSQAVVRAVRPSAGDEKAQSVGKEIQKLKVRTELADMKGRENEPGSERRLADLHVNLGNLCQATGDFEEGIAAYKKAIRFAKEADYPLKEAEANLGIGHIREKMNDWDEAIEYLNRGLAISERIDYPLGIADGSMWIGHLHWHKSEYESALKWLEKSLENAKRTGDDGIIGATTMEFGLVYSETGKLQKAIEWFEKSVPLLENVRDFRQLARVHNNLGDTSLQAKDWKKALRYFDKCSEYAGMINYQQMIGWSLFNSGEALVNLDKAEEAVERADRAFKLLEPLGDPMGIQGCYRVRGLAYTKLRNWDRAEDNFKIALKLVVDQDSKFYIGQTYHDQGMMYAAKGDKKTAKKLFNLAKGQLESIGAEKLLEEVNNSLAKL